MKQVILLTLFCCAILNVVSAQKTNATLHPETFTQLPDAIDGCSGLYIYDSISLKKKQYLIATDLQDLAYMRINGKLIKLALVSRKNPDPKTSVCIYKGGGYNVTLKTKVMKQIADELSAESGTIELSDAKEKIVIKIHGESGC